MTSKSKYDAYFRFEGGFAVCLLCPEEEATRFKFPKGCSTSGLKKHLLNGHDIDVGAPVEDRRPLVQPLLDCVLHHDLPFALVECTCFRKFVAECRLSESPVPCATTLQDYLSQCYLRERDALRERLRTKPFVCVQLDHWTSQQGRSYIGVLESHIDGNFKMKFNLLDFAVDSIHCSDITFCTVDGIRMAFGITDAQICGAVGDATNSMKRTLQLLSESVPNGMAQLCFSHVLQRALVTNYESDQEINQAIIITRTIVNFINSSPRLLETLLNTTTNGVSGRTPTTMNVTRWDSMFLMIDNVLSQVYVINTALLTYKRERPDVTAVRDLPLFDGQLICTLQGLHGLLEKIRLVSLPAQGEKTSIAYLIPLCEAVLNVLAAKQCSPTMQQFANNIRNGFLRRIQKHYQTDGCYKEEYVVAAFLAPRAHKTLRALDNYEEYCTIFRNYVMIEAPQVPEIVPSKRIRRPAATLDDALALVNTVEITATEEPPQEQETNIVDHIHDFLTRCRGSVDEFEWWANNCQRYPSIALLARRFLCIPLTSAQTERLFSSTGRIIRSDRCRLLPRTAQMMAFMKVNCLKDKY